jgi:hypothetical protein
VTKRDVQREPVAAASDPQAADTGQNGPTLPAASPQW